MRNLTIHKVNKESCVQFHLEHHALVGIWIMEPYQVNLKLLNVDPLTGKIRLDEVKPFFWFDSQIETVVIFQIIHTLHNRNKTLKQSE